jgi:hypothetical protein
LPCGFSLALDAGLVNRSFGSGVAFAEKVQRDDRPQLKPNAVMAEMGAGVLRLCGTTRFASCSVALRMTEVLGVGRREDLGSTRSFALLRMTIRWGEWRPVPTEYE